jgi:hypothetical protein
MKPQFAIMLLLFSAPAIAEAGTIARVEGQVVDAKGKPVAGARLSENWMGPQPFEEDRWVGKVLEFGSDGTGPAISVNMRDLRCVMINLDPDTAEANADVMKTVIRMNENYAGVYGTVVKKGELRVGQVVGLRA